MFDAFTGWTTWIFQSITGLVYSPPPPPSSFSLLPLCQYGIPIALVLFFTTSVLQFIDELRRIWAIDNRYRAYKKTDGDGASATTTAATTASNIVEPVSSERYRRLAPSAPDLKQPVDSNRYTLDA